MEVYKEAVTGVYDEHFKTGCKEVKLSWVRRSGYQGIRVWYMRDSERAEHGDILGGNTALWEAIRYIGAGLKGVRPK